MQQGGRDAERACIRSRLCPSAACHTPGSSCRMESAKGRTSGPRRSMIRLRRLKTWGSGGRGADELV
jgi:hypothetical protein